MTFDGIKVQHGSLDAGAADVMKAAKDIEARLDQLSASMKETERDNVSTDESQSATHTNLQGRLG